MKTRRFYGYTIVEACFFMQGVAIGAMTTYGVFFKYLQAEFGWSRAFISGASSVVLVLMGVFGIVSGRLNDRIGPRRILLVSGLILGCGYLLMSQLHAAWQLYVFYGLFVGIGLSSHDIVTLSTVARWFRKRRGMMTGVVKAGTGTGQFLLPLVASALILANGWRSTYVVIGVVILVVYVVASRLVKRSPDEVGLLPYGGPEPDGSDIQTTGLLLGQALRTPQLWLCSLAYPCVTFSTMTVLVHIVPHGTDIGMSATNAALVVSTIGAVSIAGRITMGTVGDRIGSRRSFLLCFVFFLAALVWLQFANEGWMLFFFAVVYGFAHGGFYTVLSPTVAELFGMKAHGAIFGVVYFWGTLGGAIGPVVSGWLFDSQQSYDTAFVVLLGLGLLSLLLMLRVRPVKEVLKTTGTA
ncbi:MFS transporter [Candidatus Bipolaricaulota bacterium]|nr:MFS transporter [Candidatus Bipolaricaulota bacterium]